MGRGYDAAALQYFVLTANREMDAEKADAFFDIANCHIKEVISKNELYIMIEGIIKSAFYIIEELKRDKNLANDMTVYQRDTIFQIQNLTLSTVAMIIEDREEISKDDFREKLL